MSKERDDNDVGMGEDPLAHAGDPLIETLYGHAPARPRASRGLPRAAGRQPLPDGRDWRRVTFSFYEEDVERLDALLDEARRRGYRRVSRSQIVRLALRQVDLSGLPETI